MLLIVNRIHIKEMNHCQTVVKLSNTHSDNGNYAIAVFGIIHHHGREVILGDNRSNKLSWITVSVYPLTAYNFE